MNVKIMKVCVFYSFRGWGLKENSKLVDDATMEQYSYIFACHRFCPTPFTTSYACSTLIVSNATKLQCIDDKYNILYTTCCQGPYKTDNEHNEYWGTPNTMYTTSPKTLYQGHIQFSIIVALPCMFPSNLHARMSIGGNWRMTTGRYLYTYFCCLSTWISVAKYSVVSLKKIFIVIVHKIFIS